MYWDWCGDIEPQLSELRERTDAASLDDTPQDLFRIAQVKLTLHVAIHSWCTVPLFMSTCEMLCSLCIE